jgi:hypothetical protein
MSAATGAMAPLQPGFTMSIVHPKVFNTQKLRA